MKKILFCIYIITACTYLHPTIAGTCEPIAEIHKFLPNRKPKFVQDILTTTGKAVHALAPHRKLENMMETSGQEIYLCHAQGTRIVSDKECDYETLVFTQDTNGGQYVFKCSNYGIWKEIPTDQLDICTNSEANKSTTDKLVTLRDDGNRLTTKHGVIKSPCRYYYCPDDKKYDRTKNACVDAQSEPGTIVNNVNCSEHNLPNAKECGCRYNYDNSRTCYVTKCNDGYKFGEPVNPDPNNETWKNKYKNCIENTEAAAQVAYTATTTATASEPRDEYADIIKKIENEISEYSKKCSKYTKPQTE